MLSEVSIVALKSITLSFIQIRVLQSPRASRDSLVLTHLDSGVDDPVQRFILARSLPLHVTSAFEDRFFKGQMTIDTSHQLRRVNKLTFQVGRRLCPLRIPSLSPLSFLFSLPHLCVVCSFFLTLPFSLLYLTFLGGGVWFALLCLFFFCSFLFSLLFIVFKKITHVSQKSNCNCDWGLVEETIENQEVPVEIKLEFQFLKKQ